MKKRQKIKEKILKEIKDNHVPLPKLGIDQHEKQYEETKKNKDVERSKKHLKEEEDLKKHEQKLEAMRKLYDAKIIEKLLDQRRMERKKLRLKEKAKKNYLEKIKRFDELVKENHRPKYDPVKHLEISIRNSNALPRRFYFKKKNLADFRDTQSSPDIPFTEKVYDDSIPLTPRSKGE